MAILKERLEELIEQEEIIYCVLDDCITNFSLNKKYKFTIDKDTLFQNGDYFCYIKNLYETKEEAEFVAKNHTTRLERFEPPFELKYREIYDFMSSNWHYCYIENDKNFYYVCYTDLSSEDNDIYNRFTTYSDAVVYARKLFDGEKYGRY